MATLNGSDRLDAEVTNLVNYKVEPTFSIISLNASDLSDSVKKESTSL